MSKSSQNFWDFSLQLYSADGVANACLELQDDHGLDVNMLLLCAWHGQYLGSLSDTTLQQALEFSSHWRSNVVQPLRDSRRWLKCHPSPIDAQQASLSEIREQVKKVELNAEKHQQNTLQEIISRTAVSKEEPGVKAKGAEAIRENVKTMLDELQIAESASLRAALSVITLAAIELE